MRMPTDEPRSEWDELWKLSPALRAFLSRRCRDENEIDDVVQETLLRAARRTRRRTRRGARAVGSVRSPRAWLFRIATNVLCDRARAERSRSAFEADLDELTPREREPSDEGLVRVDGRWIEHSTLLRLLPPALEELDEADRHVLDRYYRDGLDCRQTARHCGLSAGLVKVRLFRARRRLGRALVRRIAVS